MHSKPRIIVIGAGPAGLMAAERIVEAGLSVDVYDAMPSAGRKFLLAGKSGMNLTHGEPFVEFCQRYRDLSPKLMKALEGFPPDAVRAWAHQLGIETFVGSSGRVFPTDMKAAPLLRAWLHRLRSQGVRFHMRHRWLAYAAGEHRFANPEGEVSVTADASVLALGGGSWARLGSDGRWVDHLRQKQIEVAELKPANCGFECNWTPHFREKFAGQPLTKVVAKLRTIENHELERIGQFVISSTGVEGSLIYALSSELRALIERDGNATLFLDLLPDRDEHRVIRELESGRGSRSWSSFLRSKLGLHPVHLGLLYELISNEQMEQTSLLAKLIKNLPLQLQRTRPLDEAISSAGGIRFSELDAHLMLKKLPSVFCAGEMLDWEAPTGGYLLSACFATGDLAGKGLITYLEKGRS